MNDTPTPRTDEAVWGETNVVEASFARQLERELAAVTEQLTKSCMREKLADEDRKYVENQRDDAFFQLAEAQDKLAAVTKQRDRPAEAIRIHRDKAFPLTGEQFDQDLWDTLTIVKGGNDE